MKKTISINISGIIFHIEEDGYEKLKSYLAGIGRYFSTYEDSQEIIADIESRIAEIFLARLSPGKQVITSLDVDNLIVTMGTISDFEAIVEEEPLYGRSAGYAGAGNAGTATAAPPLTSAPRKLYRDLNRKLAGGVAAGIANYFSIDPLWIRLLFLALLFDFLILPGFLSGPAFLGYIILWIVLPGTYALEEDQKIKKLYRDADRRVVGGVASGIAAFFGSDPTIIRLLFVISILFFGTGLVIYLILWAITPEARTLTEKMRMQGEPVTLSNIEYNVKKSLNEEGSPQESTLVKILLFPFRLIAAVFAGLNKVLGPIAVFLLEVIRVGAGILLLVIAISFLLSLVTLLGVGLGWVSGYYDYIQLGDFPVELLRESIPSAAIVAGFIFLLIPVLFIGHLGLILLTKRNVIRAPLGWTLFGVWLLSLIALSFTVPAVASQFRTEATVEETVEFPAGESGLFLTMEDAGNETYRDTRLMLRGYSGNTLRLVKRFEGHGRNREDARANARMLTYNVQQRDSVLTFDRNFDFAPNARFRGQSLEMTLFIPVGKEFILDENMGRILHNTLYRSGYRESQLGSNRWVFKSEDGLECLTCSQAEDENDTYDISGNRLNYRDFERVYVGGPFVVNIEQSDRYRVTLDADQELEDKIEVTMEDGRLIIGYREEDFPEMLRDRNRVRVNITMPTLRGLDLSGATNATVRGFRNLDDLDLQLSGAVKADMELEAERINIDLNGASRLNINGRANRLEGDISGASRLNAFNLEVQEAVLDVSSAGNADVNVSSNLQAEASSTGRIRYRGTPSLQSNTSSAGSIRRDD